MKKYLLVNLTVLFAAAFLWAADATVAEPKVDVDASATLSWGVDLGYGLNGKAKHGFDNSASWKVKFPLIKKGDVTSTKSDVPVYGELVLSDVELNILSSSGKEDGKFGINGKVDGIEATLVFYGAYITAYDKPSFKSNFANLWDPLEKNGKFNADDHTFKFEPGFDGYGFKLGYANKDFMDLDVGIKFGSNGNWDSQVSAGPTKDKYTVKYFDGNTKLDDDEYILMADPTTGSPIWVDNRHSMWNNRTAYPKKGSYPFYSKTTAKDNHSQYGIGLDFAMKPLDKMLGIAFTINSTFTSSKKYKEGVAGVKDDKVAFGLGAEVTSEPIDSLKLKLGFDGGMNFETLNRKSLSSPYINVFAWDMLFDAGYKWVNAGMYVSSPGTPYSGIDKQTTSLDKKEVTDLAFYAKFETKGDKKEASNLVEGLDAGVYLGFYDLLSKDPKGAKTTLPLALKVWGAYKVNVNDAMWVKPYADLWLNTNHIYKRGTPVQNIHGVGLAYDLGVTFSPVEKVEVDAKWSHGTIKKNNYAQFISDSVIDSQHKGKFVLSLKIKY